MLRKFLSVVYAFSVDISQILTIGAASGVCCLILTLGGFSHASGWPLTKPSQS